MAPVKTPVCLVIPGAGSRGICEAAAIEELWPYIDPVAFGGVSAGAMNAAWLALGYKPADLTGLWMSILSSGKLPDWKQSWLPGKLKYAGALQGPGFGAMKGEVLYDVLRKNIGDVRMGDVPNPLRIKVGKLASKKTETICSSVEEHKRFKVIDVVRASAAIPGGFDSWPIDFTQPNKRSTDGGTGDNVPSAIWDDYEKIPTLTLRFVNQVHEAEPTDFFSFLGAVFDITRAAAEDEQSEKQTDLDWVLPIESDADSLNMALTLVECSRRRQQGSLSAKRWIARNG